MHLTRVAGENYRQFRQFELLPRPHLNLILGPNASGKTTLLEAIYALGRGRSFRGAPADAAGPAQPGWRVQGRVAEQVLQVAWQPGGMELELDRRPAALQELVRALPVEVLEPDSHRLLQDGPQHRREYLDWGVFHVEHRFFPAWRRYRQALRQRNQALREGLPRADVAAWEPALAAAGEEITAYREALLGRLREQLAREIPALLGPAEWELEFRRGWPGGAALDQYLAGHFETDRRQATTHGGPHRAELALRFAGRSARHQVSRGQQKLLVAALLLAQARLVAGAVGVAPVLLFDDFPAELGAPFQQALLDVLSAYPGQCFLTAIEAGAVLKKAPGIAVFHVEHGSISGALQV